MWLSATVIGLLLLLAVIIGRRLLDRGADVPLFETPAWRGLPQRYGEQLLLRREGAGRGALLLKHTQRDVVYRYDPEKRTLSSLGIEDWQRATGPVAECGKQFSTPQDVPRIDSATQKLRAGVRTVKTAGRTALETTVSPSGRWVAVLSAAGRVQRPTMPFSGAGGASGRHYHEVLSLPDAAPAGHAVRIPTRRDYEIFNSCWSADEEFVVYTDTFFYTLSVVETRLPRPDSPRMHPG